MAGTSNATSDPPSEIVAASTTTTTTTTATTSTTTESLSASTTNNINQVNNNNNNGNNSPLMLTALDYVGTKKSVMNLFSLPYSDKPVSVGIHNIEGCLIIDADPVLSDDTTTTMMPSMDHPYSSILNRGRHMLPSSSSPSSSVAAALAAAAADGDLRAADQHQEQDDENKESENSVVSLQQQQSAALSAISSMIEEGRRHIQNNNNSNNSEQQESALKTNQLLADSQVLLRESTQAIKLFTKQPSSSSSASSEPREYLPWNFSGMKMLIGSDAVVYRSGPDQSLTIRVEDAENCRSQLQKMRQDMTANNNNNTEGNQEKSTTTTKRSYAEALRSRQLIVRQDNKYKSIVATQETTTKPSAQNPNNGAISSFSAADGFHGVTIHTPILPSGGKFAVSLDPPLPSTSEKLSSSSSSSPSSSFSSPIFTVIDAYLDQLITNVPQLALVLREKGFVRSVKLVPTEHIPEAFMHETTFDTSHPFEIFSQGDVSSSSNGAERIFDPNIMQMNAASLLNFIRANCTKDNATYLLHREAGQQNIQLFDVSAISTQRQRKWIWWLAMMSYRFSHRLRHLSLHVAAYASSSSTSSGNTTNTTSNPMDAALRRSFRARERSLLQNTLALLEEFADMGGQPHEILVAEVCEKLGDTYLRADSDPETNQAATNSTPPPNSAAPPPALHQKYSNAKADALNKAQDYLAKGIKVLMKVWTPIINDDLPAAKGISKSRAKIQRNPISSNKGFKQSPARQHSRVVSINSDSDSSSSETEEEEEEGDNNNRGKRTDPSEIEALRVKAETIATHLFSLYDKLIDISLRLSELHLNTYWSSSAMQALRTAARKMADALGVCRSLEMQTKKNSRKLVEQWKQRSRLQFTRLWELCGHFARSFAADDLWRERGHAAGDDVIAVLRDVDAALKHTGSQQSSSDTDFMVGYIFHPHNEGLLSEQTGDLWDLSGIVDAGNQLSQDCVESAKALLDGKRQLRRDRRRVLVAACFAYSRATSAYEACMRFQSNNVANHLPAHSEDECKLTDRESGSGDLALLNLLRQRQGDANNELAKLLLDELRTLLASLQNPGDNEKDSEKAAEPLLSSAQFWFSTALKAFEESQDLRNSVLLRCNLCQCAKIRANANFTTENNKSSHADACLREAIGYLQAAHETIGERDSDPMTWDMVSNELAATLLVSGVRRRQTLLGGGNTPVLLQAMRLSPGETRSIVDPMEKALTIYEQSGNAQQAAAVHYQLALFYTKIWTCQRDEATTREKLSAAFTHYKKAHAYFFGAIQGNEQTFVLLCLDLSNLYSTVSGEECLCQALLRCLDTMEAFSKESIDHARSNKKVPAEWFTTMGTLAASVEDRVFKTLRSLVKIEETNEHNDGKYKNIYRQALSAKMAVAADSGQDDKELLGVFKILQAVKEGYSPFASSATS